MNSREIQIPDNWILTNFGDKNLFEILGSGITFFENEKDYYSTSSIEVDKLIEVEQTITYRKRPSRANMQPVPNSVWFAKMKNTLKVIQSTQYQIDNVIFSTGFCGIKANNIDCTFLLQVLKSENFNTQKDNLAEGTTQVAVNNQHVKNIEFLLPCSISEQQKIASILSKLDEAITQTEQLIGKYKKIKEGLMHDLLTRGIDEQGNIRSEETHKFKDSPLGRIPEEWECCEIGNACYVTKLSGFEFTKYMEYRDDGEIIAIRAMNIKNEQLILDDVQRISKKVSEFLVRSKLHSGDILITYIGAYIGDILQIKEDNKYHLAPNVAKIVGGPKLTPDFLEFMMRSTKVQRFIKSLVTTTANPSLTMGQIRTVYIIYPKDKKEQDRISKRLSTLNILINKTSSELEKLFLQKSGLMHDLLTGKVRVKI
jgi:type I restriction enzyme S subunit